MDRSALPSVSFEECTLGNGMRVIVAPDRSVPLTAIAIWYGVGSRDEQPGRTGLAHLFEHVMFQGSRNVKKGQHFETIQKLGGELNASTWWHRTNYFEWAPAEHLETLLWLEADRLATLPEAINQENVDNQRDVVKNERRQGSDNQPYGSWLEKMQARLFPEGHPYHHSMIGSMEDLSAATVEDCIGFFNTFYAPNNGVLSIVGDVEVEDGFALAERHFGWIEPNPSIPASPDASSAPGGLGGRDTFRDKLAPLPRVFFGYKAPAADDPMYDTIAIAANVLASGRSTRLYKNLVRDRQLCQDATFEPWPLTGSSVVVGFVTPKPGTTLEDAEAAFEEQVASLASDPPGNEELDRVHALTERQVTETVFQRCLERADGLSEHAQVFGDPGALNERLPAMLAVTGEQIAKASRTWFDPSNRITLTFIPEAK
ncbi:MAG: pitrilysin family protein [Actinomycetota bacterium]